MNQDHDLKRLTEELRLHSEEIERKNQQLEHANRMKSEFLSNMSHELRTPLNAIIGFSQILLDEFTCELKDSQKEYANDILVSGMHLLDLINDILDLSKIEAGKLELFVEIIYIPDILQHSLTMIREKALINGIDVQLKVADGVGDWCLDNRKCKQMIYNFLSNAVKFTPRGGSIILSARMVQGEEMNAQASEWTIDPNAFIPNKRYLEISVSDTGIGISKEDQQLLFQPFVQVDSSLSRRFEGSGLGLTMVQGMATLHAGVAALKSVSDEGSVFAVWLPNQDHIIADTLLEKEEKRSNDGVSSMDHDTPTAVTEEVSAVEDNGVPLALIIGVEFATVNPMRTALEKDGYQVDLAMNSQDARKCLQQRTPNIMALDILLPEMGARDLLSYIRTNVHLGSIPVVSVSDISDANIAEKEMGIAWMPRVIGMLQKPIEKSTLLDTIENALPAEDLYDSLLTILIVDDDVDTVENIADKLMVQGCYKVLRESGGKAAIATAVSAQPDIIVLDMTMPDVNGFDVLEALKGKPETAVIPIIIMTDNCDHRIFMDDVYKMTKETRSRS